MRIRISALLAAAALLIGASTASAFTSGYVGGGTGCSCHGAASSSVTVGISGPATLLPSETATYTASITETLVGAGLDVATSDGTLTATAAGTGNANPSEVTHTQKNNGTWSYNFDLTAPAAMGNFDLALAMLAYNDASGSNGDLWNNITTTIAVVPEPATLLMTGLGLMGIALAARRRRA